MMPTVSSIQSLRNLPNNSEFSNDLQARTRANDQYDVGMGPWSRYGRVLDRQEVSANIVFGIANNIASPISDDLNQTDVMKPDQASQFVRSAVERFRTTRIEDDRYDDGDDARLRDVILRSLRERIADEDDVTKKKNMGAVLSRLQADFANLLPLK
jgi:hypothetical protein